MDFPAPMPLVKHEKYKTFAGVRTEGTRKFTCSDDSWKITRFLEYFKSDGGDAECAKYFGPAYFEAATEFTHAVKWLSGDYERFTPEYHERMKAFIRGVQTFVPLAVLDMHHELARKIVDIGGIVLYDLTRNRQRVRTASGVVLLQSVVGETELRTALSDVEFRAFMVMGLVARDFREYGMSEHTVVYLDGGNVSMRALAILGCLRKKNRFLFEEVYDIKVALRAKRGKASTSLDQKEYFVNLLRAFRESAAAVWKPPSYLERKYLCEFLVGYTGLSNDKLTLCMRPDCNGYMQVYGMNVHGEPYRLLCGEAFVCPKNCKGKKKEECTYPEPWEHKHGEPLNIFRLVSAFMYCFGFF